jgi:hypothetical protein
MLRIIRVIFGNFAVSTMISDIRAVFHLLFLLFLFTAKLFDGKSSPFVACEGASRSNCSCGKNVSVLGGISIILTTIPKFFASNSESSACDSGQDLLISRK